MRAGLVWRLRANKNGGERGIRTLDTVARIHAFQACAFSHSATSPDSGTLMRSESAHYIQAARTFNTHHIARFLLTKIERVAAKTHIIKRGSRLPVIRATPLVQVAWKY